MILGRSGAKSRARWHSRNVSAKRSRVHFARASLQLALVPADTWHNMRTLGFRTHALLSIAAAVGVIASLAEPWFAPAPATVNQAGDAIGTIHGPVDGLAAGIQRWVTEAAGVTGWDGLGNWGGVLAGLAALTAVGALGCLVPAIQGVAREALRYGSLGTFGIAVWKLIDTPGPNQLMEPRVGAFIAVAAALIAVTSGSAVASAPLRRRRAPALAA
jgi:hypothetical protein